MRHRLNVAALLLTLSLVTACAGFASSNKDRNYSEYYPDALRGAPASAYYRNPAQVDLLEAAEDGDAAGMQAAVSAGADVNAVGRDGLLPLYWVMAQGSLEGTEWLLDHGADPNRYSQMPPDWRAKRQSPLSLAVRLEDPAYLDALLEHGGDPNQTPYESGRSLLFFTVVPRRPDNTKVLIEHGADVNFQVKKYGNTAFYRSITGNMFDTALILLRAGADPTLGPHNSPGPVGAIQRFGNTARYKESSQAYPVLIAELQKRGLIPKSFQYDPHHPQKTW